MQRQSNVNSKKNIFSATDNLKQKIRQNRNSEIGQKSFQISQEDENYDNNENFRIFTNEIDNSKFFESKNADHLSKIVELNKKISQRDFQ